MPRNPSQAVASITPTYSDALRSSDPPSGVDLLRVANRHPSPGLSGEDPDIVRIRTKQVLTVSETAAVFGISRSLAYELVSRRELPAVRLGRRIVIPIRAIEHLLTSACSRRSGDLHGGELGLVAHREVDSIGGFSE